MNRPVGSAAIQLSVAVFSLPRSLKSREIETTVLKNGVRIYTEFMPHMRSVAVGVWVGSGSRRETPELSGISHFTEHMLFKGTRTRSAEEIARAADSIGGGLDAFTAKEMVSYNVKVLDAHLPQAFDILSDLVLHPRFAPEDVEKEKGVILEEIKMENDNPEASAHEVFTRTFWKNHALGRPILGTRQTVKSFTAESLRRFHREVYAPANLMITAAGNLRHQALVELAAREFAGRNGAAATPRAAAPEPHAQLVFRARQALEQVHMYLGVPALPFAHPDRYAAYVLNTVLGGGMSSRLFQNIRERQGLAYAVFSEMNLYRDAGCLTVYAGTGARTARRVVESIVKEFRDLQDHLVTAEELRRVKDHLKGSFVLGLESSSSRMANLARQQLYFGRFVSIDEMLDSIEAVTAEEVQKLAQQFFDPKRMTLAMLGPIGDFRMTRGELHPA